jgi:type IV secretory pathway VirB10-like protein
MSTNQGSARDYIKSYVQESNTDDYLKQEQPRYDPTKPIQSPQTAPVEQDQQPTAPAQASEHFKVHLPTQNPIPSSESAATSADQEPRHEQPQITWTARDFKDQRNEIHETSLTICADLHEDLLTCFQHGSWWDKAKMCEEQKQKFWSCYNAQKVAFADFGI